MKRRNDTKGKAPIYCPWQGNRVGVLLEEGPQQSRILFSDDREGLPREMLMVNTWFMRGSPRVVERVKLKPKRVRLTG
jgi:hypothetical protein